MLRSQSRTDPSSVPITRRSESGIKFKLWTVLREYFLHLPNVKKVSSSTLTAALYGIKFFYEQILRQPLKLLDLIHPPSDQKLPVVLTMEEVRQILSCVNFLRYLACLGTIYACGLRIREGVHLQVKDIDSKRGVIHVRDGKGNKDRYVPLPQPILKRYWEARRGNSPTVSLMSCGDL